jgi:hypothetical protein
LAFVNPQPSDFRAWYTRDFPYGTDPTVSVLDSDIANAMVETNVAINPDLFADQSSYTLGYLKLSAHYLVLNLRASSQGINGQWAWLEQSKSAGSVATAFGIPQRVLDNPVFAGLCKTNYGAAYLLQILPALSGAAFAVCGGTLA